MFPNKTASAPVPSGPDTATPAALDAAAAGWPRLSILMPVYNPPLDYLSEAVASALAQTYGNFELCIVDDASTAPAVWPWLEGLARCDSRIRLSRHPENRGIAAATNTALALADGDYFTCLDHDDRLSRDALAWVAALLRADPTLDLVYSDEDKLDARGNRFGNFFKPDWSPEYTLSMMYTCHLSAYRRSLVAAIGGYREAFDGAQDFDLFLRFVAVTRRIGHVPRVLYHWRAWEQSTALSGEVKPHARRAALEALRQALAAAGLSGTVSADAPDELYGVRLQVAGRPMASIIVASTPDRDGHALEACCEALLAATAWGHYEIIVAHGGWLAPERTAALEARGIRFSCGPAVARSDNPALLFNQGSRLARGGYLVLLRQGVRAVSPDWLTGLLEYGQLPGVGAVGPKLLFADGSLAHVGVVFPAGRPVLPYCKAPAATDGYYYYAKAAHNCLAVTGACLLTPRALFFEANGLDIRFGSRHYADDYCLRLHERGWRCVFTPHAVLGLCEGGIPDRAAAESELFAAVWHRGRLPRDPYYNPNLSGTAVFTEA